MPAAPGNAGRAQRRVAASTLARQTQLLPRLPPRASQGRARGRHPAQPPPAQPSHPPEPMAPKKSATMVRAPMHMPPKAAAVGMYRFSSFFRLLTVSRWPCGAGQQGGQGGASGGAAWVERGRGGKGGDRGAGRGRWGRRGGRGRWGGRGGRGRWGRRGGSGGDRGGGRGRWGRRGGRGRWGGRGVLWLGTPKGRAASPPGRTAGRAAAWPRRWRSAQTPRSR